MGRRAAAIALGLADRTQATLAERGVPDYLMPSYRDLVLAMWPVAETLAWSRKHERKCRKLAKAAKRSRAQAVASAADVLEGAAAYYAGAARARRPDVRGSVPYDPAAWHMVLQPRSREAA